MRVRDYMPLLYEQNVEMNAIMDSETEEFENGLKLKIDTSFNNTFIKNADEQGISNYENILNIKSNPADESIEFRRERVINRLTTSIPFSETFMINRLNEILGEGQWNYTLDYNDYTLTIRTLVPRKRLV